MKESFEQLKQIIAKLRAPGGCPWDAQQTYETLLKCVREEAQEIEEAVTKNDILNLEEEVGDLLITLLMISEIAEEKGDFTVKSVLKKASEKLVERHTWVFGEDKAATAEEALELWKKNKAKKKQA